MPDCCIYFGIGYFKVCFAWLYHRSSLLSGGNFSAANTLDGRLSVVVLLVEYGFIHDYGRYGHLDAPQQHPASESWYRKSFFLSQNRTGFLIRISRR